jgi:hypothetical protein
VIEARTLKAKGDNGRPTVTLYPDAGALAAVNTGEEE